MQQLLPRPLDVDDVLALLAEDPRPDRGRPWVMANMVTSVDGAWAVAGRSGGLAAPGDRDVFRALRDLCDVVLAAAGTVRDERYRRPAASEAGRRWRERTGRPAAPRLAVISGSLRFPADQPFLTGEGPDPLLLHPDTADAARAPDGVTPVAVPTDGAGRVDLGAAIGVLADRGAGVVLCEGGPNLLGSLAAAGLVDELFLTVSPRLVGGADVGLLGGAGPVDAGLRLHRVLSEEDTLLLTYRTAPDPGVGLTPR